MNYRPSGQGVPLGNHANMSADQKTGFKIPAGMQGLVPSAI